MAMTGWNFQFLPQLLSDTIMYYRWVDRQIIGGYNGQPGSLPSSIPAGSTQSYSCSWTIPASYNVNKMRAIAILIDNTDPTNGILHRVLNSAGTNVYGGTVGIRQEQSLSSIAVFPNPCSDQFELNYNGKSSAFSHLMITDVLGNVILDEDLGEIQAGSFFTSISTGNFHCGIYFVNLVTESGVHCEKIEVLK